MKRNFTPNDIDVLLHYHSSPRPHPRVHAPAVQDTINMYLNDGILEEAGDPGEECYATTEKGKAFVKIVCSAEYPELKWVDSNGCSCD
jgi:hypothetical protein